MYKAVLGAICCLSFALSLHAQSPQEKGLQSISRTSAEAIVGVFCRRGGGRGDKEGRRRCKDAKQACTVHDWLPAIWHPA